MASNQYQFLTEWRVKGDADQVFRLLQDAHTYPAWWPDVYLGVEQVAPGKGPDGIGETVRLLTKGALPYKLRWTSERVEADRPRFVKFRAQGDFDGWAIWTVKQEGDEVVAVLDWRLNAEKPLLKIFSPVLKPVFKWNHYWAMDKGLETLKAYLVSQSAADQAG